MRTQDIPLTRYQAVVMDNPRKPGEGPIAYIVRVAELAGEIHRTSTALSEWNAAADVRLPYRDSSDTNCPGQP